MQLTEGRLDKMIKESKLKHIMNVARIMAYLSPRLNLDPKEMFVLGYLHDVGYEWIKKTESSEGHGYNASVILENDNYKYSPEVRFHGKTNCLNMSVESRLLNWTDMHVNSKGEIVTFDERLLDIKKRYGETSHQYINSEAIVLGLKKLDFLSDVDLNDVKDYINNFNEN